MVKEDVATPSGYSVCDRPHTPTSTHSAPPSVRSIKYRKRSRILRGIENGNTITYSAPTRLAKSQNCDIPLRVITSKFGSDVPKLEKYNEGLGTSYYSQNYIHVRLLGKGYYSETAEVMRIDRPREHFAIKIATPGKKQQLLDEIIRHEGLLPHPNIVKFFIGWEEGADAFLLMELCSKGSLDKLLKPDKIILEESVVWSYFNDILLGVAHLHSLRRIHCDLKPANIMLTDDNVCKIGDFGLLYVCPPGKKPPFYDHDHDGDGKYIAPEMLNGCVSPEADIFSLGVTLLELACRQKLPDRQSSFCSPDKRLLPPYLEDTPEVFVELIHSMMSQDRRFRPSAVEIIDRLKVHEKMSDRQLEVLREYPPLPAVQSSNHPEDEDGMMVEEGEENEVFEDPLFTKLRMLPSGDATERSAASSRMEEDAQEPTNAGQSGVYERLSGMIPEFNMGCSLS